MCSDSLKFHFFLRFPRGRKGNVHKSLLQKRGRQLQQQLLLLWDKRSLRRPPCLAQIPRQNASSRSRPAPTRSPSTTPARCFCDCFCRMRAQGRTPRREHESCKAPANPASFRVPPCEFRGPTLRVLGSLSNLPASTRRQHQPFPPSPWDNPLHMANG